MRITSDTKDAVLFMVGVLGLISQGIIGTLGGVSAVSPVLLGAYLSCAGLGMAPTVLGNRKKDPPDDRAGGSGRDGKDRADG